MKRLSAVLILILVASAAVAETVSIKGLQVLDETRYHRVDSEALGRGYDVLVGLPRNYDESESTSYPTIYILDGGLLYPLLRGYHNYLRNSDEAPEAILVGISYGSLDYGGGNLRSTDYTAPSAERAHYGGAENFQTFLADELLPFIENEYRSSPQQRVIFGQSIGGQFVMFTAHTQPDLFWGHIASNAALHRNLPFFLELHGELTPGRSQPRLYFGSGSHDNPVFREPALSWIGHWADRNDLPWALRAETLDSHTHFSAPPASFRRGLKWVFELGN